MVASVFEADSSRSIALFVAAFVVLAFFALIAWTIRRFVRKARRRLYVPVDYAVRERIATPDGSSIGLIHLGAPEHPLALPPVLLVHGLAANHRNQDLHPDHSIARHLHERGRDVWLVTLRSGEPPRTWAERSRIRYDSIVDHDLAVATQEVLARTGATQLDYVGYSMGGMLLYGAMSDPMMRARIRRVAIIGSPSFLHVPLWLRWLMRIGAMVPTRLMPTIPVRFTVSLVADVAHAVRTPIHSILVAENASARKGILATAMVVVLEDMPGPLVSDFCRWQARPDGTVTYRGTPVVSFLPSATMPALFIAGSKDPLGRRASVHAAFEAWGGTEKEFIFLGRESGASTDYAHGDMVLSNEAKREVFEPLEAFLRAESNT